MGKRTERLIVLLASLGSLMLLNALALQHFLRVDLTRDDQFTLSPASVATMQELEDPIQVTAYFSSDLPAQFAAHERYVRDLLEEYHAASEGLLGFEFIDPHTEESEEDRATRKDVRKDIFGRPVRAQTQVEIELEQLGIQPVEIRVIEADAQQTRRGYLGIVIRYREESEVIPVVQNTTSFEYDLTSLIRRLVRTKVPVLGITQIHGEAVAQEELSRIGQLLVKNYDIRPVAGETLEAIEDDVDALLIVGNQQPYSPAELQVIDQFLMLGKSAAFLLDLATIDLESFTPTPVAHGFGPMLASYGVSVGSQLVADVECASLNVGERRGFMVLQTPVKYPFIPQVRFFEGDSPMTRGLGEIMLPFSASLQINQVAGVEAGALVRSSRESWLEPVDPMGMNPRRDWASSPIEATGPYTMVAHASGSLPSFSAGSSGSAAGGESTDTGLLTRSVEEARIIVAGTSNIARDPFVNAGNAALVQNMVDWMLLDPGLLEMRTRTSVQVLIDPDLSDTARNAVKYGNTAGLPGLLVLYGLARRARRNRRRVQLARHGAGSQ